MSGSDACSASSSCIFCLLVCLVTVPCELNRMDQVKCCKRALVISCEGRGAPYGPGTRSPSPGACASGLCTSQVCLSFVSRSGRTGRPDGAKVQCFPSLGPGRRHNPHGEPLVHPLALRTGLIKKNGGLGYFKLTPFSSPRWKLEESPPISAGRTWWSSWR